MKKAISYIWSKRILIFFLFVLFVVYWTNTFHTNFSDEFDNIVGGWYINHGTLPYTGFFSHHNPGSYYLSAVITFFTGQSFVAFRKVFAVILFLSAIGGWYIVQKRSETKTNLVWPIYLLSVAISATYYWGHMMLSETLVAYTMIPAYALVLLKELTGKKLYLRDCVVISLLCFAALFTSFTFLFAGVVLIVYVVFRYFSILIIEALPLGMKNGKIVAKEVLKIIAIISIPYVIFLLYLVFTGSLSEFLFQSIEYNRNYYIYNFPTVAGQVSTHPIRYAISIFHNTTMQFLTLATQVTSFNFSYPVNITLLLGNAALLIYLLSKRKFGLSLMIYSFLVFLNARGEPLNSKETDFHSTVYIMTSLFHIVLIQKELWEQINQKISESMRWLYKSLFVLVGIYAVFLGLFFFHNWETKVYLRFMGQAPGIYDEPVAAPIINKLVPRDEYVWIGPFEFQELLYINARQPSKYHWFLPASSKSDKIRKELQEDFSKNKPTVVVFKEGLTYFGVASQEFSSVIVDFLKQNYFRLKDLETEGLYLKPTNTNLHNFDIEKDFYFDKEKKGIILERLWSEKLVEEK